MDSSIHALVKQAKIILQQEGMLDKSGGVLYSSANTLAVRNTREGRVLLMGTNPGGDAELLRKYTVGRDLDSLDAGVKKNAYTSEDWISLGADVDDPKNYGKHRMQQHVLGLARMLRLEISEICATNLFFSRSRNLNNLSWKAFCALADSCWRIHELIIRIVRPSLILAFGNNGPSSYAYLRCRFGENVPVEWWLRSGYSNWWIKRSKITFDNRPISLIGLPHLSYYAPEQQLAAKERRNLIAHVENMVRP